MKTRMHPSIILEKILSSLAFIVVIAFSIVMQMLQDGGPEALKETGLAVLKIGDSLAFLSLVIFLLTLGAFTIYFYFVWRNTYLYFDQNNLIIEKGKIFKKITTIHLSDIASINIKRSLLEKILGTSNLKFVLNTNSDTTFNSKLVFKDADALKIKNTILTKMGKEPVLKEEELESVLNYTVQDVFRHMWLSIDLGLILFLFAFYIGIIMIDISLAEGVFFVFLTLFLVVGPIIWNLFTNFLSYYNFKVSRDEQTIKLAYGAITTYKYSLPINRIHAVMFKQTFQARLTKYTEIEVVNAGIDNSEDQNVKTLISLYVKEQEKNIILKEIVPEYNHNIIMQSLNKDAFKQLLLAKSPWYLITLALSFFSLYFLILLPLLVFIAYLQYKTAKIGYDDQLLVIQKGIINKRLTLIKYEHIELMSMKKTLTSYFFQNYLLTVKVVGPAANNTFTSSLFPKKIVNEIISKYLGGYHEH